MRREKVKHEAYIPGKAPKCPRCRDLNIAYVVVILTGGKGRGGEEREGKGRAGHEREGQGGREGES